MLAACLEWGVGVSFLCVLAGDGGGIFGLLHLRSIFPFRSSFSFSFSHSLGDGLILDGHSQTAVNPYSH